MQEDFEKAGDARVLDLDAGISDRADGDRQGNLLQEWKVDMDVEPLGLEAGEAADDGLEPPDNPQFCDGLDFLTIRLGVKEGATGKIAQIPNEIMFAFYSDQLRPNASNILAECAELIKREHAKHVRVIGHSESVGRV